MPTSVVDVRGFELVPKSEEEDQGTLQTTHVVRADSIQLSSLMPSSVPNWWEAVAGRMVSFLGMENNWDSYGAAAINRYTVESAINFLYCINLNLSAPLSPPAAVPTSTGGIQLEWHTNGVDLEIELSPLEEIAIFFKDRAETEEWTLHNAADFKRLEQALSRLTV